MTHYLLSLGVVNPRAVLEEDLVVTDVSRRNTVFLATSSQGPAYVVKEPGAASSQTLAREAAVLGALGQPPALRGLVPELVHYDAAAVRLVLRTPAGALDWSRQRRLSPLTARALGRAMAAVHAQRPEIDGPPPPDERLLGLALPEPSLAWVQGLSAGGLDLLAQVQADRKLCEQLRRLRGSAGEPAFTHGDLRFENCLLVAAAGARRRTRVLLIDWEQAGPGEPEHDVATALAEYLRVWIDSFPAVAPGSDLARADEAARVPLAMVQPAAAALWTEYRRASGRPADSLSIARLAAVRLLETAFEYCRGAAFVPGHVIALVQVAASMLRMPGQAAWNLLRLRT